jgi:hypothetical protein
MTDGTFEYVAQVKWYQFWRWKEAFNPSKNYLKSRLHTLELAEKMTQEIKHEIDKLKIGG